MIHWLDEFARLTGAHRIGVERLGVADRAMSAGGSRDAGLQGGDVPHTNLVEPLM